MEDLEKMKNRKIKTLKEYFEVLLLEQEKGTNDLYQTFIQPFADVVQTAAYGIETLSAKVQTVIKSFLLGLPTLFIPFLEYDYETFREQERQKIEDIRKKYEKTLQWNIEAIVSNDPFGLAFILAPGAVLGAQLAVRAPERALRLLNVLTGNSEFLTRAQKRLSGAARVGFRDPGGHHAGNWAGGYGAGGYDKVDTDYGEFYEEHLFLKEQEENSKPSPEFVQALLKSKEVQKMLMASPIVKSMKRDAVKVIVDHVKRFLTLNDYNEMRKLASGDQGFAGIGQELKKLNQSGQVPQEENTKVTQVLVPELKKIYKNFWIEKLRMLAASYPEAKREIEAGISEIDKMQ